MVTRDTPWTAGTPCWVDLGVSDIGEAQAFYSALFGWAIEQGPPETGGYAMCMKDGRAAAGIGPKMGPPEAPSVWMTYISTDDADETAARIKAAGGQVMAEPFDVMDVGRMAVAVDPAGAVFGIWQPLAHIGVGVANEPGALAWNENMSRDLDANKAFYRDVFGYDYNDMGPGYASLRIGTADRRRHRRARPGYACRGSGQLDRLLHGARHRCGHREDRRAGRQPRQASLGYPVWQDGRGERQSGRDLRHRRRGPSRRKLTIPSAETDHPSRRN